MKPFDGLPMFGADIIMIDNPWSYLNWSKKGDHKNASAKYDCMSLDDIKALPVGHYAKPDCLLWMWATNPLLREAFEVMDAWGFRYVTAGHWVKRTKHGKLAFGTGYVLRCAGEPFLIGALGEPKTAKNVRSVIEGPVREHSRKPDEAYQEAEKLMPDAHVRLDIFSRENRPGWISWGNEVGKFEGLN